MANAENPAGPWSPLLHIKNAEKWEDPCPIWDDDGQVLDRYQWRHPRIGRVEGNGTSKVLWLAADSPLDLALAEEHPSNLPEGPVRMIVVLTVHPGGLWNPPSMDFVELSWSTR